MDDLATHFQSIHVAPKNNVCELGCFGGNVHVRAWSFLECTTSVPIVSRGGLLATLPRPSYHGSRSTEILTERAGSIRGALLGDVDAGLRLVLAL